MSDSHVLLPPLMCFQSKRFVTNTDPGNGDPLVTGIIAINCEKLFPLSMQRSSREGREEEVLPVEQEASRVEGHSIWRRERYPVSDPPTSSPPAQTDVECLGCS